jgi:hypothetical protein
MLIFYGFVNVGAFFMLATTYAEKYVGFWLSFLLAGIIYFLLPILLFAVYKKTYKQPPAGSSELSRALKISGVALRQNKFQVWRKDFWEAVKPANLREKGIVVDWTDNNVRDVSRAISKSSLLSNNVQITLNLRKTNSTAQVLAIFSGSTPSGT